MKLHVNPAHADYKRSLAKTITWRIIGSVDTFVISYFATGEAKIGLAIAGTEVITKMVLYYFHERGWSHVRWGLVKS